MTKGTVCLEISGWIVFIPPMVIPGHQELPRMTLQRAKPSTITHGQNLRFFIWR